MNEEKEVQEKTDELTDKELDVAGGGSSSRAQWERMMRERATRSAADGNPVVDFANDSSP